MEQSVCEYLSEYFEYAAFNEVLRSTPSSCRISVFTINIASKNECHSNDYPSNEYRSSSSFFEEDRRGVFHIPAQNTIRSNETSKYKRNLQRVEK